MLHAATNRRASYGSLAARAATLPVPAANSVRLKDPKNFKIIGTRVGGYQNQEIVTGKPLYGIDQKVPGMFYAVYQKCPVYGGTPVSANLDKILTLPGVKQAFIIEGRNGLTGGVAILADSTWSALSARRQLEVTWDEGDHANDSSVQFDRQAAEIGAQAEGMSTVRNDGDTAAALATAAKVIEAKYAYPFISHANLEPQNTLANVQGDRAEFWSRPKMQDPAHAKSPLCSVSPPRISPSTSRAPVAPSAAAPMLTTWLRLQRFRRRLACQSS